MNRRPRLVILNPTCLEVVEAHRAYLDASGMDWMADAAFRMLREEQVDGVLAGAEALILPASIRSVPSASQMARHRSIRVISIAASGWDWLDLEAATANGIVVAFAPVRAGVEVVADMTFGLMLAVARQIPHFHRRLCAGDAARGMGVSVWGKTLGIVGLGRIGRAVARRAVGFEMEILACEPSPDRDFVARHGIRLVDLDTLLRRSDYVSLHVRLDATTRAMLGSPELGRMKPGAILVNTARRELVDEDALADAILGGRLGGAGLDDPPARADSPLLNRPNVVFAPHHGNRAIEGVHAVFRCAIDNAAAVLAGRRPEFVANPEVYGRPCRAALSAGSAGT